MNHIDEYIDLQNKIKDKRGNVKLGYVVGGFLKMDSLVRPEEYEITKMNNEDAPNKNLAAIDNALFKLGETKTNMAFEKINLTEKSKADFWVEFAGQKMAVKTLTPASVKKFCTDAPFGDLKTNTTKVDHTVRHAWTCPNARFLVGEKDVCDTDLYQKMEAFFGGEVELIPHALNMYEAGGHFKSHVDTQRHDRMVGTFVVVFSTHMIGGDLIVDGQDVCVDEEMEDNKLFVTGVMFHAATPHSVTPVEEGVRYSVSYDVCLSKKRKRAEKDVALFNTICKKMDAEKMDVIGVMLRNRYSPKQIEQKCFLGEFDCALLEEDTTLFSDRHLIPVLWSVKLRHAMLEEDRDRTVRNVVYTLDETEEERNVPFFCEFTQWTKLFSKEESGSSFTGNEAQDGKSDRIYASYAVLLTRARNATVATHKKSKSDKTPVEVSE